MKVLDLFSGAGGFSLGFELAGAEIVGGMDIDEWATDTFRANHPSSLVVKGDISKFSTRDLESTFASIGPDIIVGGPPCQGFSIANKNSGDPKDPRNSLFKDFIRAGEIFQPRAMIMENVTGLLKAKTSEGTPVLKIIKQELEKLGYFVYSDVLEAVNYGVPQIRKRLFVIASKVELLNPFPEATHSINPSENLFTQSLKRTPSLWDAISDLPEIEAREGAEVMEYDKPPQNEYQKELREDSERLYNHLAMKHSKRLVERFKSMTWGQSTSHVPDELKPHKRNSNGQISGKAYDQNNRRMFPDKPCHTIPASFYANFVHPYKNRNFTAREGARIQSFPDKFIFKGKPTVVSRKLLAREGRFDENYLCQYNQIGNAVPPKLSRAVASNLLRQISKIDK